MSWISSGLGFVSLESQLEGLFPPHMAEARQIMKRRQGWGWWITTPVWFWYFAQFLNTLGALVPNKGKQGSSSNNIGLDKLQHIAVATPSHTLRTAPMLEKKQPTKGPRTLDRFLAPTKKGNHMSPFSTSPFRRPQNLRPGQQAVGSPHSTGKQLRQARDNTGLWVKIEPQKKTQVLVHGSTYQGSIWGSDFRATATCNPEKVPKPRTRQLLGELPSNSRWGPSKQESIQAQGGPKSKVFKIKSSNFPWGRWD